MRNETQMILSRNYRTLKRTVQHLLGKIIQEKALITYFKLRGDDYTADFHFANLRHLRGELKKHEDAIRIAKQRIKEYQKGAK